MKKDPLLYGIIGLLAGLLIAGSAAVLAVNNDNHPMMNMMGMNTDHAHIRQVGQDDDMSMGEMTDMLRNKTGDDFDAAFIGQMIAHHQGAINMANLAKQNAKHDEIKNLADDILAAQSKEIDMMQTWQGDWGYKNVPQSHMMYGN